MVIRYSTQLIIFLAFSIHGIAQSLPDNMPPFTVTLNGTQGDGYLFVSPIDMTTPNSNWPSTILLLDNQGAPVFYMPVSNSTSAPYARQAIGNFQLHNNGLMSFTDALFGPGESIFIMDSTFTLIDTLTCTPPYKLDGHDFVITDDGHYHLLAMEERIIDMSASITESGPYGDTNCLVIGHIIQEFDETNTLVGEWKSLDHFAPEDIYWYYFLDPSTVDHAHVNSLFVDHEGNYIISSRSLNEVTRINHATGDIMWRLGGKNNEFTLIGDTTLFTAQHDAQYYSDGRVVLFDNGTFSEPHEVARMLTCELDTVAMTANAIVSEWHPNDFYSGFMGSYRYVDPNHRLVCWGGGYNYSVGKSIQEFDEFWNETMSLDLEDGLVSYRALKATIPWEINRPEIDCDGINSTLSGPSGASSYLWSTGDSTQSITITSAGIYQLWTNIGDGFISSEPFEVLDSSNICSAAGLNELVRADLTVFPNPANEIITIQVSVNVSGPVELLLTDLQGRVVRTKNVMLDEYEISFNVSDVPTGLYRVTLMDNNSKVATKLVNIQN